MYFISNVYLMNRLMGWLLRYCCCSVAKSCLTPCDSMDYSMPGSPVLHCLPELAQIHVHSVGGAISPSLFMFLRDYKSHCYNFLNED